MWIYFSVLAAIFWAVANIIDEYVVDSFVDNPLLNALVYSLVGLVAGVGIFMYKGVYYLSSTNLILCLVAGAAYTVTISMYFLALKKEEVTRVAPLVSLTTIFTAVLAAIFLNESFTAVQYFGIALIIFGSVLVSIKIRKHEDGSSKFKISKAVILMTIGALFSGISAIIEKYLMNINIPADVVFGYSRIGVAIPAVFLFFIVAKEIKRIMYERKRHIFGFMLCSETVTILGTFFIFLAMSFGPVTLVSSIVTTEPVFVLILASLIGLFVPKILKQELNRRVILQKAMAILFIILGVLMII